MDTSNMKIKSKDSPKLFILIFYFLAVFQCFANEIENSQVIQFKNESDLLLPWKFISYLEDRSGRLTLDEILKPENHELFRAED
jgi:hypothetical protein